MDQIKDMSFVLDEWTKTACDDMYMKVHQDVFDALFNSQSLTFKTVLVSSPKMKWRVDMLRGVTVVETWTFADRAKAALHVEAIKALEGVK